MPYTENGSYVPYAGGLWEAFQRTNRASEALERLYKSDAATEAQIGDAETEFDTAVAALEAFSEVERKRMVALGVKTSVRI